MTPPANFSEAQAKRDLTAQLARLGNTSLSWPTDGLRPRAVRFGHACESAVTAIETDPKYLLNSRGEPDPARKALIKEAVQHARIWLGLYGPAALQFEESYVAWDRSMAATAIFSPAAHSLADTLLAQSNDVRQAVGSIKDDGSVELSACRKAAGIGRTVNKGALTSIRDLGREQVAGLAEPTGDGQAAEVASQNRNFLLSLSVLIDAHIRPVAKTYAELMAELDKPLAVRQGPAHDNLNHAQVKLEAIVRRLLALINAGGDAALREQVEKMLPPIPYAQRKSDRAPADKKATTPLEAGAEGQESAEPAPKPKA